MVTDHLQSSEIVGRQNDWINANVENIVAQRPITFNRERKLSEHSTIYPSTVTLSETGLTMNR